MQLRQLKQALEALLFVTEQPLSEQQLLAYFAPEQVSKKQLLAVLDELRQERSIA